MNWGVAVTLEKYFLRNQVERVKWFQEHHVLKCGQWFRSATPPGITTSISGQEGYHSLLKKIEGPNKAMGSFVQRLVNIIMPYLSLRKFGRARSLGEKFGK